MYTTNYHNSIHIRYYRNKKSDSYRIISDIYIDIIIRITYRSLSESIRFIIYLHRIYLHNIPYTIICIYTTVIHRKHSNYYRILHCIIRYTYRVTPAYGSVHIISNYYLYIRHARIGMVRYTHRCIFDTVYLRLQARTAIFLSARSRIPFGKICSLYGILGAFTGILRKKRGLVTLFSQNRPLWQLLQFQLLYTFVNICCDLY